MLEESTESLSESDDTKRISAGTRVSVLRTPPLAYLPGWHHFPFSISMHVCSVLLEFSPKKQLLPLTARYAFAQARTGGERRR